MALEKPPLATVEPGRPITAQGWNAIVDALSALYDAVLAFGSGNCRGLRAGRRRSWSTASQIVAEPVGEGLPVDGAPAVRHAHHLPRHRRVRWRLAT